MSDEIGPSLGVDAVQNTPRPHDQIFSPAFTKTVGEHYPKDDWALGLPPGTMSTINRVMQLQPSWLDTIAEINDLAAASIPPWMDTAVRVSAELESLIPTPVIPQSLIDSLIVSPPDFGLAASTAAAIRSLGITPTLNMSTWLGPLIVQSDAYQSALEIAALGKVYELPTDLFNALRFLDLPSLAESKRHLPTNWHSVNVDPGEIEAEVREILEEGIPLAWIPAPRVIDLLLDATNAAERRQVIVNNYRGILTSCEELAGRLSSPGALHYADVLRKCIRALRDGHTEAAQALASNLLDTIVSNHTRDALGLTKGGLTNATAYTATRKRGWRLTLALHPLTMVMASGTHTTKNPTRRLSRNATVHAITRQQYTRINAVLAIMNAASVLACFVRDTPAFD